ncbi:MAG: hypothetical protein A7316_04860 [Candidatus Altiarchaeales archaeon WOR_SM1_86-2]|nr:MAG: hypothetical protein A7315_04685 [Candidatus Altiarchaeales archaeon WOR_SM1_79]ODS39687.1 MAG: hypothetical protein A7316_04860 [Candidatus Altiarchaeales archaeon WOR_SM1_86-2]
MTKIGYAISQVLEKFLDEQGKRLKPATMRKYREVIELLKDCLNGYAYQSLDKEESGLYKREDMKFCDVFGSEKILPGTGEFMGYFMVRKVIAGKEFLKYSGTVTKKLAKWLHAEGFVDERSAEFAVEAGSEASKVLPGAEELSNMLYDIEEYISSDELIEEVFDHFSIMDVKPDGVVLSGLFDTRRFYVKLPHGVVDKWHDGWEASLQLGKTGDGWHIISAGNVYPL